MTVLLCECETILRNSGGGVGRAAASLLNIRNYRPTQRALHEIFQVVFCSKIREDTADFGDSADQSIRFFSIRAIREIRASLCCL